MRCAQAHWFFNPPALKQDYLRTDKNMSTCWQADEFLNVEINWQFRNTKIETKYFENVELKEKNNFDIFQIFKPEEKDVPIVPGRID